MKMNGQEKFESRSLFASETITDAELDERLSNVKNGIKSLERTLRILSYEKEKRDKKAKKVFLLAEKLAKLADTRVSLENSYSVEPRYRQNGDIDFVKN